MADGRQRSCAERVPEVPVAVGERQDVFTATERREMFLSPFDFSAISPDTHAQSPYQDEDITMDGRERNQALASGFDLINHAIRMGAVGDMADLRNALFRARPPEMQTSVHALPTSPVSPTIATPNLSERLSTNAFQFPWKLHDMLDGASEDNLEDIVAWHDAGRSFRVHKPHKFVELIMCRYFKQTKYKSFQRQLNLYGFSRINDGPAKGGYRHNYFVRGQRTMCQLITRSSTADAPRSEPRRKSTSAHEHLSSQVAASLSPLSRKVIRTSLSPLTEAANTLSYEIALLVPESASCLSPAVISVTNSNYNSSIDSGSSENGDADASQQAVAPEDPYKALVHKEFQFPWKLHEMLDRSEVDSFERVVSWQPGNLCFKVHDPPKFVVDVLPRFFKQTKYKSFQRQLNLYGFVRGDDGPNKGAYRHKCFVKGKKELLNGMTRHKIKNTAQDSVPSQTETALHLVEKEYCSVTPLLRKGSGIPVILAAIECAEAAAVKEKSRSVSIDQMSLDGLSWRQSPDETCSDWVIELVQRDTKKKTTYNVHRRMLAVGPKRSEYFVRLFKSMHNANKSVLELGSVEAEVFPLLLDHMYANSDLNLDTAKAYSLYSLAEQLEIPFVLQAVTDFYRKSMNSENLFDFFAVAESFRDKTLLGAVVDYSAVVLRHMDEKTARKMKPARFIEVVQKSRSLSRMHRCTSSRLSQLVAACIDGDPTQLTKEIFQQLTESEHLPYVEPIAAIKLLAVEKRLAVSNGSLHERCISSITQNWAGVSEKLLGSGELSNCMRSFDSSVLYEILMRSAKPEVAV